MSQKIQTMFADIAPTYDQANHALSFNKDILWRKESIEQMGKDGFVPKMVLDLCAGAGGTYCFRTPRFVWDSPGMVANIA